MIGVSESRVSPRLVLLARFLLVGLSGIAVNELVYVGLVQGLAIWFVVAAIVSTQVSTTWNFLGNEMWAFSGRRFAGPAWARYVAYAGMNNALLLLRVPMLWALSDVGHVSPALSNLVALGVLFAVRFAIADGLVWRKKHADAFADELDVSSSGRAAYRYDIGGLIRLDSDSELPELAYFRSKTTTPPDIRIRIRRIGIMPNARVRLRRDGDRVTYREHLGILGADFNVTMGQPIEIEASPLLAFSRHVLYTNVVEALLRFVLVSKGYVLLHSAGMEVDGQATLLSAQTDTGKTSTVINLVRQRGWGFISDDMAIIDPAGRVRTFPKPMTLSYHTMVRAVDADSLSSKQRLQLQVQSRVHSKSGRSVGKGLGSLNVPIMSINSVVQLIVPPPKYHITALMPARITPEAPIANVFLMERGEPIQEQVSLEAAVDQLIENTDDAYGFPPFATLAPTLVIGGEDYQQLRTHERALLTEALKNVNVWRLRVRGHEWGDLLPRLMGVDEREPVGIPIETNDRGTVGIPIDSGAPVALATSVERDYMPVGVFASAPAEAHADIAATSVSFSVPGRRESYGVETYGSSNRARQSHHDDEAPPRRRGGGQGQGQGPRGDGPPATGAADASPPNLAEAVAMPASGSFGLAGVSLVSDLTEIRARAIGRIRTNARVWVTLAGILLVGAAVRLWSVGAVGFNNDEAVYAGQGAALAGDQTYGGLFAIFRAHPLLVQFLNSIPFRLVGVNDITPRLLSVAFGLAGVALAYSTGALLYNRRVGLIAAAILALMPYHVVVTRQALLDGPETTLFLLSIYLLGRFIRSNQNRWLFGAAFTTGLTVLAKETAVLIVPVAVAFLLLTPEIRIAFRNQVVAIALFLLAAAPYPAAILIGKGSNAAGSFVLWQVLRQANHTWTFYGDILPGAVGPLVLFIGLIGLLYVIRRGQWQDRLILCWVAVPVAFFEIWPVKGFQYLLPIAPAIAILVGLSFDRLLNAATESDAVDVLQDGAEVSPSTARRLGLPQQIHNIASVADGHKNGLTARLRVPRQLAIRASSALLAVTLVSIAIPTAVAVGATSMTGSLAGTGGLPGGRPTGMWIRDNVPQGAVFLTEGPTLANIIEYYGQRRAYGLSVSPNPIRRNPAYDPIVNPDRALQLNQIQYIATDIWSAQRSPFFNTLLKRYVSRYHGKLVFQQSGDTTDAAGRVSTQVVIQIFEVRP